MPHELDDVDRGIVHMLQEDARDRTIQEMGERVGVSASTVRNRIEAMEEAGVIRGYHPHVDYAAAGFDLHVLYIAHVAPEEREQRARDVREVSGVVEVHELLDSNTNVVVEAVARDPDHMAATHDALVDLGFTIRDTLHVRNNVVQPFDHFGESVVDRDS